MWSNMCTSTDSPARFLSIVIYDYLLSCRPGVTVTSCFVYKVIRDLELMGHLCIKPIIRIGFIHR